MNLLCVIAVTDHMEKSLNLILGLLHKANFAIFNFRPSVYLYFSSSVYKIYGACSEK